LLIDKTSRRPYKHKAQDSQHSLNQIFIRTETGVEDMAERSPVVAAAKIFEVGRVYIDDSDQEAKTMIEKAINESLMEKTDVEL
jgi:hypothetical protein